MKIAGMWASFILLQVGWLYLFATCVRLWEPLPAKDGPATFSETTFAAAIALPAVIGLVCMTAIWLIGWRRFSKKSDMNQFFKIFHVGKFLRAMIDRLGPQS
jgi:hypothetical protein